MNKYKTIIAIATTVIVLVAMNNAIWQKETHLKEAERLYMALAPVDPRSIMQGDYMTLRFRISAQIRRALFSHDQHQQSSSLENDTATNEANFLFDRFIPQQQGKVVVYVDANKIANFVSLYNEHQQIGPNQRVINYKVRKSRVKFATNAFFFEEGDAELFSNAQYGEFALNKKGEVLLTGLYDEQLKRLGGGKY